MKDDQIEQVEMDRLERLARDRGYLIAFPDGTTRCDPSRIARVQVIDLADLNHEGGFMDVRTLPLGEVEAHILESSG